jgi:hypothetical protein
MTLVRRLAVGIVAVYVAGGVLVLWFMCQPPVRFGRFMRYAPAPLVFGTLPAERMWLWARGGGLHVGDAAPDFSLPLQSGGGSVRLSSFRGRQPVALVFGSYT